jgi:hypothetical protein
MEISRRSKASGFHMERQFWHLLRRKLFLSLTRIIWLSYSFIYRVEFFIQKIVQHRALVDHSLINITSKYDYGYKPTLPWS